MIGSASCFCTTGRNRNRALARRRRRCHRPARAPGRYRGPSATTTETRPRRRLMPATAYMRSARCNVWRQIASFSAEVCIFAGYKQQSHARKVGKTDRRLRHQHNTRKIPELPAHALLYPYLRAGVLWNHHRRICPHTVRTGAADARHGVGVLPLCRQGRSRRRRRAGCETAPLRNDLGHNVARSPDLSC